MSTDMATLTGAYAVNALTEFEQAEFERHLAECADCAQEVRELQETAARLGTSTETAPPEGLRQRVLAEVSRTRQEPPHDPGRHNTGSKPNGSTAHRVARARWGMRLSAAAAVLGVALAGTFGAIAWQTQQELEQAQQRAEQTSGRDMAMAELMAASDARIVTAGNGDLRATTVLSDQLDRAMFLSTGIEQPPPGHTYQLWFIGQYGFSSAGLLKQDRAGHMAPIMAPIPAGTSAMGVTLEPGGGSEQPTTDPVLKMDVPL
ncbi:anti-sigma factor [Haloactinomyces albus]|uniref:Regulator of SigK n=1 Tax=Haloactinomyces albus TaxID=1352928 RepID=A0AAE3ZBS0_9ACTN|nr:anti-sigma factor [Haloactinomyces albus]MDR7300803.1 anti-sigma-K factor RskA [Haloactinomyces albus]